MHQGIFSFDELSSSKYQLSGIKTLKVLSQKVGQVLVSCLRNKFDCRSQTVVDTGGGHFPPRRQVWISHWPPKFHRNFGWFPSQWSLA